MRLKVCALLLVVLAACNSYCAEVVQQDAKPLTVSYSKGAVEHYIVKWAGTIDVNKYETGHPAEPLNGWLFDTRQCHWSITSSIVRKVYLLNHNGQEFAEEVLTTPLTENFANKGSDYVVTQLRPENCGDAQSRFDSDVNDSKKHMVAVFPKDVAKDYEAVINTMKDWPDVTHVQPK